MCIAEGKVGWEITGNTGITAANFLGTINAADLIISTTNTPRMYVAAGGNVGIGDANVLHCLRWVAAIYFRWFLADMCEVLTERLCRPLFPFVGGFATGIYRSGANDMSFSTAGTQRMVINSSGYVGIGVASPSAGAMLDVTATNKGVLIPRVALTSLSVLAPIVGNTTSTLVYNSNTASTGTVDAVTPGYYYWNGTAWVCLDDKTSAWSLVGNTGTNDPAVPGTYGTTNIAGTENWMGTTDANDLVFGTNNRERMRVKQTNGRVGIGTAAPNYLLDVSSGTADAIYGHSASVGGFLGYETNFVVGSAGTIQGAGVWAANPTAGYTSLTLSHPAQLL